MMEQVRICAVWPTDNWLGYSLNQIQGWTTVRESYSRALEQGSLIVIELAGCLMPHLASFLPDRRITLFPKVPYCCLLQSWPKKVVLGCVIPPVGAVARSRNLGQTILPNSIGMPLCLRMAVRSFVWHSRSGSSIYDVH